MPHEVRSPSPGAANSGPFTGAHRLGASSGPGAAGQPASTPHDHGLRLPALLVATAAAGVGWAALVQTPTASAAQSLSAVLVLATSCVLVRRRAGVRGDEREVWSRLARALQFTVIGIIACSAAAAACGTGLVWAVVSVLGCLAVYGQVYGALIRWNRYATALSDPHDLLNGFSSLLVGAALLDLVARAASTAVQAMSWWHVAALGLPGVMLVVCLGTAVSLPSLAGLARDPRLWIVAAALVVAVAGASRWALSAGRADPLALCAGGLAASCVLLAAQLPQPRCVPRESDPVSSTRGAMVVLLVSAAVLLLPVVAQVSDFAIVAAGSAVIGAGARLGSNVRDLGHLAVTRRQALTDDLTGLANRRALLAHVDARFAHQSRFVMGVLDLDGFKEVNDGLGHIAGDELIRLVSRRLRRWFPEPVVLARLGGDEFAVVFDLEPHDSTERVLDDAGRQVLGALEEPFTVFQTTLHVSASVGLTLSVGLELDVETGAGAGDRRVRVGELRSQTTVAHLLPAVELLRRADAAMYEAKRSRAGVAVYDQKVHERTAGALTLVEELREALIGGGLVLYYQPQVSVASGVTIGLEALVRWQHPVRGLLAPADFLDCAEVHGLMGALTDVVLEQAVAELVHLRGLGLTLRMSVNLPASSLLDTTLPTRVAQLLLRHRAEPRAVVLEVTETELITDPERSLGVMRQLADLGISLSIDDYGTGYSSLAYLQALPVDEVKLDRAFTATLLHNPRTRAVVSSTVDLAHALGMRVVAEGVEDAATLAELADSGCDATQGYLHTPPLPRPQLLDWLSARSGVTAPVHPAASGGTR